MVTGRSQAAHESADDLWRRLVQAGEDGLARAEAMGGNTPAQFERAKTWIRDLLRVQEGLGPLRRPTGDEERGDEGR